MGREPRRLGLAHPSIAPYGVFRASDGEVVISIQNEREWKVFCEDVLAKAELTDDPRFARNTIRVRNRDALDRIVQQIVGQYSAGQLCDLLDRHRIAYGRVSSMDDLIHHRSATVATVETPAGPVELMAPPVTIDGERPRLGRVPDLGEHDEALRIEFGRST